MNAHPEAGASAHFYDGIAATYDASLTANAEDRWTRDAFHELVRLHVPPGATLLDFGCGTGIDAERYAAAGFRVLAYDNSRCMIARCEERCAALMARSLVRPWHAAYEAFLAEVSTLRIDAVVSNFAVLNLIAEPGEMLRVLAGAVRPGGPVIVSILNPWFWKDALARWRARPARCGDGALPAEPRQARVFRHTVRGLGLAARPCFEARDRASVGTLPNRWKGDQVWARPGPLAERVERVGWRSWPLSRLGRYHFLVFRRVP